MAEHQRTVHDRPAAERYYAEDVRLLAEGGLVEGGPAGGH
jgi:hypothetical protein